MDSCHIFMTNLWVDVNPEIEMFTPAYIQEVHLGKTRKDAECQIKCQSEEQKRREDYI